jgi:hypothetical protein
MNAEGDNVASRSSISRISTCIAEIRCLANDVVGRQHQHQSLAIAFAREESGSRDRRTRISADRLEDDIRADGAVTQLLSDDETELRMGDNHGTRKQRRVGYPMHHLLEG